MAAFTACFVIAQVLFFGWVAVLIRRDRAGASSAVPVARAPLTARRLRAALELITDALATSTQGWGFEPSELAAYVLPAGYVAVTGGGTFAENEDTRSDHDELVPHAA